MRRIAFKKVVLSQVWKEENKEDGWSFTVLTIEINVKTCNFN